MIKIHSLDSNGDVIGTRAVMKRLFQNFMVSDYSQTSFYLDEIASLRYIYSHFDGDADKTAKSIEKTLLNMYNRYFRSVEIEVQPNYSDDTRISFNLFIKVVDENGKIEILEDIIDVNRMLELYEMKG